MIQKVPLVVTRIVSRRAEQRGRVGVERGTRGFAVRVARRPHHHVVI